MTVQTTYDQTPAIGFNGMLAEQFSLRQVDSGLAEGGALGLAVAVKRGTTDNQYVAAAADEAVEGVVIYSHHEENPGGDFEYPEKSAVPVLSKGRYYGVANAAIAVGAALAYDPATGKVGAVVGTTTTLAFATAKTSAGADGDLLIVEVNF
jgi:hypothetical protein